jgi:hypothetical protein
MSTAGNAKAIRDFIFRCKSIKKLHAPPRKAALTENSTIEIPHLFHLRSGIEQIISHCPKQAGFANLSFSKGAFYSLS